MKTAMQEIIDRANSGIEINTSLSKGGSPTEVNRATHLLNVCQMFKILATELLKKEKENITEAYDSGWNNGFLKRFDGGQKYYDATFNK